jgi:hypothetical protein
LSGDEDAISCRLGIKTQVYVNVLFPKSGMTFIYGNGDLRAGEVRREPGARDGRGKGE